jgi:hypothetical protein
VQGQCVWMVWEFVLVLVLLVRSVLMDLPRCCLRFLRGLLGPRGC